MRQPKKFTRAQNGVALVLTLLILTLLVVTSLELNRATRVEANLAGNFRDLTQASYIAQSGVEIARAILQGDDPLYDGLDEKWAQFETLSVFSSQLFPEGHFSGKIEDENAKFNPNGLIDLYGMVNDKKKKQLERLITLLGYNPDMVMDAILDWLDPDDTRRPLGAERETYMSLKRPYAPKNGPLDLASEMLLIKGIDAAFLYGTDKREGLLKYLTLYSDAREARININTASPLILMSLADKIDQHMAQAVLDYRQKKSFRSTEELRSIPGWGAVYPEISSEIAVASNYFSIEINGYSRGAQAIVQTAVKRLGKGTRVLYWVAG